MSLPATLRELEEVLADLESLLKNPAVGSDLAERGVNISLALVAKDALRSYLFGDRKQAAEDFATVAEEVTSRLARRNDLLS